MDNTKTGAFIKALRTQRGLTQRELAERLHITDRAVSKWERGLSAPDIALLEPLADILEVSVVELIRGERALPEEHAPVLEEQARDLLAYSDQEARRRERRALKRALLLAAYILGAVGLITAFFCWRAGYFYVLDRRTSPDRAFVSTVYRKALSEGGFSRSDCISVIDRARGGPEWRCEYGDCAYKGLWWSPDSEKYVLVLDCGGEARMSLVRLKAGTERNLNAYLDMAVGDSPLEAHGIPREDDGWGMLDVDYEFVQWGPDGDSMLVYYSFTGEADGAVHAGYFWFDCELACLSGLFEVEAERSPGVPFSPSNPIGG